MEEQGLTSQAGVPATLTPDLSVPLALPPSQAMTLPLSVSQREVWLDQRAWPDSVHLNIGGGAYLKGRFDLGLFKAALACLVAEHQALRLVPHADDGSQTLLPSLAPRLDVVDLGGAANPEQAMREWWLAAIQQPFELGAAPPWRFTLLHANDELHGLTIQFHHLVMDGWGTSLVMQRWSEIYNTLAAGDTVVPSSDPGYLAFIEESNHYRQSDAFKRDGVYWNAQMPVLPEPLVERLHTRPGKHALPAARLVVERIARADYNRVSQFAVSQGLTTFNLFLAALALYFARVGQRTSVAVGVPSLNRGGRRYRETLGMFVGVMAVQIELLPEMTGSGLLSAVGNAMRGALRHPRFPLSELGRNLEVVRAGRDGLFDLLLSFERQDYQMSFGAARLVDSRQLFSGASRYPLGLTVCEFHEDEDVELIVEASESCFAAPEAALMGQRVWQLVNTLSADLSLKLSSLPVVPPQERQLLLEGLHAKVQTHAATEPFIVQFERQAALRPKAPALVWDGGSLDYGSLNHQAGRLARRLAALGAGKDRIVAVVIERSADMVLSILAIAKAGAAFLPLDPDAPVARLGDILTASGAVALLIQRQSEARLSHLHRHTLSVDQALLQAETGPEMAMPAPAPQDLAYVLFTSGSTGKPKGVMIEHATLSRRLAWLSRAYGVTPADRSAQATQITFDPSLIELCLPLIHGASVALPPPGRLLPESLADFAVTHGVTIMAFVPSTLSRFLDAAAHRPGLKLRVACCGGEVLPPELVNRFLAGTQARLYNVYGPTETAIFATAWECQAQAAGASPLPFALPAPLPIGSAIDDTRIYVLDSDRQLLPFGVCGEIYIGGGAVGRGYLNRPDLTEAVFVDDPFQSGAKMYRSGDRGWLGVDGNLRFVGRIDRQIKLRGYRIELGEIEAALMAVDGVAQAAAKLVERDGKPMIHAWVTAHGHQNAEALQRALRMRLPDYMIPSGINVIEDFEESASGKIDYAALPEPDQLPEPPVAARAPHSKIEHDLLALWQEVLKKPTLTVEDNFFDAGGDSLAAVSMLTGIEKLIGRRVPMYLITERPTVAGMAAALGEGIDTPGLLVNLGSARAAGAQAPGVAVYLAASGHGDLLRFQNLARALGDSCELRMLQPPSASTVTRLADLAGLYADIVSQQGAGPCYLAGFSVGGLTALETARQLQHRGVDVRGLFLIDTIYPSRLWGGTFFWRLLRWLVRHLHIQDLNMNGRRLGVMLSDPGLVGQVMAVGGFRAKAFDGPTVLVKSAGLATWNGVLFSYWKRLLGQGLSEIEVQGLHGSMFDAGNVGELAGVIKRQFAKSAGHATS